MDLITGTVSQHLTLINESIAVQKYFGIELRLNNEYLTCSFYLFSLFNLFKLTIFGRRLTKTPENKLFFS